MPRGPAPKPNARRRNAPTIAGTNLPAEGRKGRAPAVPKPYSFKRGSASRAWWDWAWKLPQATQWDAGAIYFVARRASLEDDLAVLERTDELRLEDYFDVTEETRDAVSNLEYLISKLKSLAGGRVSLMKEMRELDNRLGLNPKAMIDLRWSIADPEDEAPRKTSPTKSNRKGKGRRKKAPAKVAKLDDYRHRIE